jgi:hypothetical protein
MFHEILKHNHNQPIVSNKTSTDIKLVISFECKFLVTEEINMFHLPNQLVAKYYWFQWAEFLDDPLSSRLQSTCSD